MRDSQPWVPPLSYCPSQSNKVKAKFSLSGRVQSTRNYFLQDKITVVKGARPASSQLQVGWAVSHSRSMVKSGREARTWLPGSSSRPQSHFLSSVDSLGSSMSCLLPLTQREQSLLQEWKQIMQTALFIFKNKNKRKSILIWPGTWLSPSVLLLFLSQTLSTFSLASRKAVTQRCFMPLRQRGIDPFCLWKRFLIISRYIVDCGAAIFN